MAPKKFRNLGLAKINFLRPESVDDGDGNWLVSYADMMTLLFGFFVLLTIFSTPDSYKFEKLKQYTAKSMGGSYVVPFNELSNELKEVLNEMSISNSIRIENLTEGLILTASTTRFFSSASAKLYVEAEEILKQLANILKKKAVGFKIVVEGHTDDVPISTTKYASNWELSLLRASEVVRLFESHGIPHEALRPIGMSDIEPLIPIENLSGKELYRAREKNRRIVIKIIKTLVK